MKKVFAIGDIHGDFRPIRDFYERNKKVETFDGSDSIILLGDSGLNYYLNYRDENFKKKLGKYPFTYFVVRGNHEERASICAEKNPDNWIKETFWGGSVWVEKDFPYIKYAEDGPEVYHIPYVKEPATSRCSPTGCAIWDDLMGEYKTLVLPGAYSVDKDYRLKMGWHWFPQEQMTLEEQELAWDLIKQHDAEFDLVLSHTCPCSYEPTDLFLSCIDQTKVDKSMEFFLGGVEFSLNHYKAWLWGHYHAFRFYPIKDGKKKIMLDHHPIEIKQAIEVSEIDKIELY